MSGQWNWWEQEQPAHAVLRKLAVKAGQLGRLPTAEDIKKDVELPTAMEIVMTGPGESLEGVLMKLAGLLYKRGTCPVDLTEKERNLPEAERLEVERQYREFYERRLTIVSRPGGIREIEEERQSRWQKKSDIDESKVVKLPILSRRELWEKHDPEVLKRQWSGEESAELTHKEQSGAWRKQIVVSVPSGGAKSSEARIASLRPKPSGVRTTPPEVKPREKAVPPPKTGAWEKNTDLDLRKGADSMSRKRVTKEQAQAAVTKVYQQHGKVSQSLLATYAREHKGEGIPAVGTVRDLLGSPTGWAQQAEEYLREHPELTKAAAGADVDVSGVAAGTPAGVPETASLDVEAEATVDVPETVGALGESDVSGAEEPLKGLEPEDSGCIAGSVLEGPEPEGAEEHEGLKEPEPEESEPEVAEELGEPAVSGEPEEGSTTHEDAKAEPEGAAAKLEPDGETKVVADDRTVEKKLEPDGERAAAGGRTAKELLVIRLRLLLRGRPRLSVAIKLRR